MKWRTTITGAVTLPVLISMIACGGKSELSRGKAEKVIQASDGFKPAEYRATLGADTVRVGLDKGFWKKGKREDLPSLTRLLLTSEGKTYFSGVSGRFFPNGEVWVGDQPSVVLGPIPRRVTEVTGVTDGPGIEGPPGTIKDVQFTWKWDLDRVPKDVKPFLGPEPSPSKGEAMLKLYDDGWRVEELKLD